MKRAETFEAGARRETKEEVEIDLREIIRIGEYQGRREYKRDTVQCFLSRVASAHFQVDELEIAEAGWFFPDEIMLLHRVPTVDLILRMYENNHL